MTWLWIAGLALALYALLSGYVFHMVFGPSPNPRLMPRPRSRQPLSPWRDFAQEIDEGIRWFEAQETKEEFLTSRDGFRLRARVLERGGSRNWLLLAHGYRSVSPEHDFSCALKRYHELGWNILLIDQRAQFGSGGRCLTMGVREREDVADWAWHLEKSVHPRALVLDGMSMGASTVLMALALKLPPCVKGVIADSGYTTVEAILRHVMRDIYGLPAGLILPGLKAAFRLATGRRMGAASAPGALAGEKLPVLLVHGEADLFVPCDMARENAAAAGDMARLVTVPGAGHGVSLPTDRERCERALRDFFDGILRENKR